MPVTLWLLLAVVVLSVLVLVAVPSIAVVGAASSNTVASVPATFPDTAAFPSDDESGAMPTPTSSPTSETSSPAPELARDVAVIRVLEEIPDRGAAPVGPYFREQFGQTWFDQDRNGCDTRNDVLARDLADVVFKEGTNECKVLAGWLLDPYTGETVPFESGATTSVLVQIDHVVALSWAWRHGAEQWTFEQRMEFANDPANLLAVSGSVNQSKSDSGPSQWLPPSPSAHCDYAGRFLDVVAAWGLALGDDDRRALGDVLDTCA